MPLKKETQGWQIYSYNRDKIPVTSKLYMTRKIMQIHISFSMMSKIIRKAKCDEKVSD